ncbi:MAG: ferrous iron transport protein A [Hydrotalea flava]|uniref:FeoA family protein n=1 Tax=Hydrotalea TaxID=1004300 RepID=UPI0009457181|nr:MULTISPECIES: FeoA family protein [Hydrotalea]MBY0348723.1 ferrous iron transport protein A [Hydrotalea flava]NIM35544.1 ferrous iron transport protein A [Hydrotalea flava]NIM38401.1 ferrous iron transport protein A [Hydrotalea flava]NIN03571.1 ferrous iron transport protein A [Hydrotalea flava]NIN15258.1 ferrous iron transport protein A [Hydrotalea flava]
MKPLSQLKIGDKGTITTFKNDELFIKLMEMGCVPGEMIKVEQIAPLGDPISISVAGYSLSLRLNEAAAIMIDNITNEKKTHS